MQLPRIPPFLLAIVAGAIGLSVVAVAYLGQFASPGMRYQVSLSTEGVPIVGSDFNISVTVRDAISSSPPADLLFLSVADPSHFEFLSPESPDDPWALPETLNISGMDLSGGRTFLFVTTPVWAAEQVLWARVWFPRGNLSSVRFLTPARVDLDSVVVAGFAFLGLTSYWPVELAVSRAGNLTVGGNVSLVARAQGTIDGPRTPSLLFLSLESKPTYYRIVSDNSNDDPWGLPNVWNLTGMDLSVGVEFTLNVSPLICGVPVEARVWSPRGDWSSVQYNSTYELQTPDAVFLWGSKTFDFRVC